MKIRLDDPAFFSSLCRTGIIGNDENTILEYAGRLIGDRATIFGIVVCSQPVAEPTLTTINSTILLRVNGIKLMGSYGHFSAAVCFDGAYRNLGEVAGAHAYFDLILDLQSKTIFPKDPKPPGYFGPGAASRKILRAVKEVHEEIERFEKPQSTVYLSNYCTYRQGGGACFQCIDICPFGAIQKGEKKMLIDYSICEGCGCCAAVCPTGAIRYVNPPMEDLMVRMRLAIESGWNEGDNSPTLLIHNSEFDRSMLQRLARRESAPIAMLPMEEIGCVGVEILLVALAYGAGRVIVASGPATTKAAREAVEKQIDIAGNILSELELPSEALLLLQLPDQEQDGAFLPDSVETAPLPIPSASFSPFHDKRTLIRLSVRHLSEHCQNITRVPYKMSSCTV